MTMINQYIIKVRIDGHYTERDVNCPPGWEGSGIYDRHIKVQCETEVEVWAPNAQVAEKLAEEFDYQTASGDWTIEVDRARVINITLARILRDRDEDEVGVIEPVNVEWDEK